MFELSTHVTLTLIALVLLITDLMLFGFASFVLVFIAVGALCTALLVWLALIPDSLTSVLITLTIATALSGALLYPVLKKMKGDGQRPNQVKASGDFIGLQFTLEGQAPFTVRYSGITWRINSAEPLSAGDVVEVDNVEPGQFYVRVIKP